MTTGAPDNIRLMYIQPAEVFGGAERQGVAHIARLAEHGFEVVPVVGPGTPILDALHDNGVYDYTFLETLCHEPDVPASRWGQAMLVGRMVREWAITQRALVRLGRERRVQMVFANRSTGWLAGSLVARVLGVPQVWRGGGRLTHPLESVAIAMLGPIFGPDLLLTNCEAVRTDIASYVRCPSQILPNAVDTRRLDPRRVAPRVRHELGLDATVPVVGFLGRPAPGKGMELLAGVVARTARQVPAVRFLIAGEFSSRRRYEQMFAAEGLGERVRFLGHLAHLGDVAAFLKSCDAVVLTSSARSIEGSPNSLLEAMAMERPVVATRVGGVAEAMTDGVEGFLADDGDAETFAARLVQLLGDDELRHRMGAAGRATILRRYEEDKVVASLARLLREVHARAERGVSLRRLAGARRAWSSTARYGSTSGT